MKIHKVRASTFLTFFLGFFTYDAATFQMIDQTDHASISAAKRAVEKAGAKNRDCFYNTETIENIYRNFAECMKLLGDFQGYENDGPAVKDRQILVSKAATALHEILKITENTAYREKSKDSDTEGEGKVDDYYDYFAYLR